MKSLDPFAIFTPMYLQAIKNESVGNAMVLSTAGKNAVPNSRVVLLAEHSVEKGFVFYTDYTSQKAEEIAENTQVSLLFYWPEAYAQVRIQGVAEKTSAEMSDAYFYNRAKEKQLAATLSHQSQRLDRIESLREKYDVEIEGLAAKKIIRPQMWGGYQVMPWKFEFWAGSEIRLHSRVVFEKGEGGEWLRYFLQP